MMAWILMVGIQPQVTLLDLKSLFSYITLSGNYQLLFSFPNLHHLMDSFQYQCTEGSHCVLKDFCVLKWSPAFFTEDPNTAKAEIHIKQTQTKSGLQCQRWDSQSPHKHKFTDVANFPDANITNAEAFCRSPQAGVYAYPWCFTTDPDTPEENCNVAKLQQGTVYPKKYAHGFVVLCFVVVIQSFIMNSHEIFIHINQGCFAGTGAIVRLPQCQWSKPAGYGKISQCITTTKHSKAKSVCIFLGIYCSVWIYLFWKS